nr:transcription-repair coupling factor [Lolliginicoccus suaedae]
MSAEQSGSGAGSMLLEAAATDEALRLVARAVGEPQRRWVAPPGARWLVAATMARSAPVLMVTTTTREAEDLLAELRSVLGGAAALLPSWETLPHERLSPSADTVGQRMLVLRRLARPDDAVLGVPLRVVVAPVRALVQPLAGGLADVEPVVLRAGADVVFDEVIEQLVAFAYKRVDMVARRGEFAVRGGILDIFPPTADHPVRVEFWGDEVSEIREFSVADQRSIDGPAVTEVVAVACRELLLTDGVRERAARLAETHAGHEVLAPMLDKIGSGIPADGMEALTAVLTDRPLELVTDVMPRGAHVLVCDPEKASMRAADLRRSSSEFLEASWSAASFGGAAPLDVEALDLQALAFRPFDLVAQGVLDSGRSWWTLSPFASGAGDETELPVEPAPALHGGEAEIEQLFAMLRGHAATGGRAAIAVAGAGTVTRFLERLKEHGVPARQVLARQESENAAAEELAKGLVTVVRAPLSTGLILPQAQLIILSEADLTGNRVAATPGRKLASKRRNQVDPLALKSGDLVVHDQHGIGRFVEMAERTVGGARREYLVLEYASSKRGHPGDRLFVPMESLDQLSRYVGGEAPSLSKMGGSDWQNTKRKARQAVREIAGELVQLYAKRQASPGHAFAQDTPWQHELEDAFAFAETEDQLTAIADVKADMERPVPMDRVVCGDVGFGKTEIAVRAAFKAVQDGKQVAVLVPTTLLAQQHTDTFTERMTGFPIKVRQLSRFTDPAESREVINGLADGSIDIVIGTHRLLQTGVRWKDLGLVIVDEEQRFGVEHKEHIKALRTHVDMLTMSATPIPRTLEMSLAGIREMSTILTPPEERLPVLTYVGAHEDKHIAAAIRRELLRDGQVFYVHNRVSTIDKTAKQLRELVPEARIVVAHGQMNEETLEQTVEGFWNREYDVLVCTTIIETGLDISNANTLIVERADQLGLSQLHQLRGRVGRGRDRGYAYFLYPANRILTETAYDRLATISQNSELGAGMAVAMKDLEIRGAGNVLGAEQSGHVAGVGFDLYIRLVGEAVEAFKAIADGKPVEATEERKDIKIDLPVDAHIPTDYVASDRLRLEAYRKLAAATDSTGIERVIDELIDRYGPLPEEAKRLISIARLRLLCREKGITDITMAGTQVRIAPLELPDSKQVRLKRLQPSAQYRATTSTILMPLPRAGRGTPADPRVRDNEVIAFVADFLTALDGQPQASPTLVQA